MSSLGSRVTVRLLGKDRHKVSCSCIPKSHHILDIYSSQSGTGFELVLFLVRTFFLLCRQPPSHEVAEVYLTKQRDARMTRPI